MINSSIFVAFSVAASTTISYSPYVIIEFLIPSISSSFEFSSCSVPISQLINIYAFSKYNQEWMVFVLLLIISNLIQNLDIIGSAGLIISRKTIVAKEPRESENETVLSLIE